MTQPHQAPDAAARALLDAQAKEYGTYVAKQDIYVGTALAYRAGDPVPASNVDAHGYAGDNLVVKTGTKAAEQVAADAGTTTPAPDSAKGRA